MYNCGQEVQWVPDYDSFGSFIEQQEKLKKEKEEAQRRERLRAAQAAEAARKRKKKKQKMMAAAAVTVVAAGAVIGLVFWNNYQRNYNSFDYQMERAQSAFSSGEYQDSYEFASRAVTLNRDSDDARLLLAEILVNLDQSQDAREVLEDLIQDSPDNSEAYGQLIEIYAQIWDELAVITEPKKRFNTAEHLVHTTKKNQARLILTCVFQRCLLISEGQLSSMPWEVYPHIRQGWNCGKKTDQKGGRPKLVCDNHAMPVFYRDGDVP